MLLWIGTRSYGLYLYHWPIYQVIRKVAGHPLSFGEFALAVAITAGDHGVLVPGHRDADPAGHVGRWWRRLQAAGPGAAA